MPQTTCIASVRGLLGEAVSRVSTWESGPRTDVQRRLTAVILDEIAALRHENLGLAMPVDPHLLRVAAAILDDQQDRRGLDDWASWAHVSPRTMSRRFRVETGLTFTAWRQHARLLRALKLLADGNPVTTIGLDLGYENVSSFISLFHRTFGVTPGRYAHHNKVYSGECVRPRTLQKTHD